MRREPCPCGCGTDLARLKSRGQLRSDALYASPACSRRSRRRKAEEAARRAASPDKARTRPPRRIRYTVLRPMPDGSLRWAGATTARSKKQAQRIYPEPEYILVPHRQLPLPAGLPGW